jgi:pantoate--beta-alanine ligase
VRAADGLALSSRNGYLTETERAEAPRLSRLLQKIRSAIQAGATNFTELEQEAVAELNSAGWKTDYVAARQQSDLNPPSAEKQALVVLAASRLGNTRLIDNIEV